MTNQQQIMSRRGSQNPRLADGAERFNRAHFQIVAGNDPLEVELTSKVIVNNSSGKGGDLLGIRIEFGIVGMRRHHQIDSGLNRLHERLKMHLLHLLPGGCG